MKTYLNCKYREKDLVKSLGAKWDYERRAWFVDNPANIEAFRKWVVAGEPDIVKKKSTHRPQKHFGTTGVLGSSCCCDVLPWEDCEHTIQQ